MSAYDRGGITIPGEKMKNLALIVPVLATFTIACDDSQQQIDVADTTQTSRDLTESEVAFAERATYITRAATVVDIASRAARLQPEALDTLDALGCDITIPEELSTADGSCDETGTDVFVIDVSNCTTDHGDSFDMSIAVGGEGTAAAFALASAAGLTAEDYLAGLNERATDIMIDTGDDYQISACGITGESGLRSIAEQRIDVVDADGEFVTYASSSTRNGVFDERSERRATLRMTDASQPQHEAAEIELNVRSEGSSGLTPESGVAVLGENRRIVFRKNLTRNNNVMFQSVFRYQEVVEVPTL